MKCPKCGAKNSVKAGILLGRQRYKCKNCTHKFTRLTPRGKPRHIKRLALHMYLEGMGLRSIGRILKVSNVAVLKWVRKAGEETQKLHMTQQGPVRVMEFDELRTFIGSKKTLSGYGLLMIGSDNEQYPLRLVLAPTPRV